MINIKNCRSEFLSLLNSLYTINNKNSHTEITQKFHSLKQYIQNEYFYDKELPKLSHQFIEEIKTDLENIENLYNNFLLAKGYDLPNDIEKDGNTLVREVSRLKRKYYLNDSIKSINKSHENISSILNLYKNNFGETNTIKALQCGLDIFCKERKHIFKTPKININGMLTDSFINLIDNICSKYSEDVIEKYLVKGLKSNTIFETKDNKNINTKTLISKINETKNRRIYE